MKWVQRKHFSFFLRDFYLNATNGIAHPWHLLNYLKRTHPSIVKKLNNLDELTSFNAKYGHREKQVASRSKTSDSDGVW